MEKNLQFEQWMDDFFVHLFSQRPVDATFAGLHDYNGILSDVSPSGLEKTNHEITRLLTGLSKFDRDSLERFQRIDYDLAEGFLKMQDWERSSGYSHRYNPVTYTSEAAFSLLSLFLSDTRSIKDKQPDFDSRLRSIPQFLANARVNLAKAPTAWTERAIRECTGALAFLEHGISYLQKDEGLQVAEEARESAVFAFKEFSEYLRDELSRKPYEKPLQCGPTVFGNILSWAHGIESDFDVPAYAAHAEKIVESCTKELEERSGEFGASTSAEALAQLKDNHPSPQSYMKTFGQLWEKSRLLNAEEQLVHWADYPIVYRPIPDWAKKAQPYLYFLFYRCPPRWNRPPVYRYNVPSLDPSWSTAAQENFLRANNTFVLKTNHVLHHGGIGHHVQNWNAARAQSRIAQIAANDGPARLTMLCGGTLCEGWACYISELAGHKGFLTPLESYAEISSRRRMAARAVVDIRLHTGVYSLEEAAAYYQDHAMMPAGSARDEAVKNSLFPGGAIMYLYGVEKIEQLRTNIEAEKKSDFSLKDFHDTFLSYGTIPVARIAKEMLGSASDYS